jgi:predicted amidohydrolase YtcJ
MLEAGIQVGAGTDATRVASYNPWISLYWMVTGRTVGGTQLALPENRLSREEALRLYTVGSAWFSGEEEAKGRIAPGQFADFAILSADYMTVPEEQIRRIESVLTVTGGDVVYSAGPFTTFAPAPLPPVSPRGPRWRRSEVTSAIVPLHRGFDGLAEIIILGCPA